MFVSVKKKEPLRIIVGNEENSSGISKMFEVDFPYALAIPSTLRGLPKECKNT